MKNYQALLMTIVGFGLGIGTMNGVIQNYIGFAGVKNEMTLALLGMMVGIGGVLSIDYKKLIKALI